MTKAINLKIKAIPVAPYFQVKEILQEHISKHMEHGEKLPSERTLSESAGIARATIAKAINQLVTEGTLVRIHGKGTYVSMKNTNDNDNYLTYFNNNVKLKHKFRICVIYNQREDHLNSKFLYNCQLLEEVDKNMHRLFNAHPFVVNLHDKEEPFKNCIETVKQIKPDGIMFVPPFSDNEHSLALLRELQKLSITIVVANSKLGDANTDSVTCDNKAGLELLVDYLVAEGHKNIAFVTRNDSSVWGRERLEGYKAACIKNNIPDSAQNVFSRFIDNKVGPYIQIGKEIGSELFADLKYSAIIGVNDSIAVGLFQAAREAGLTIPADCSLAGFDNFMPYREYNLTTLNYPIRKIAENALGILLLRLHSNHTSKISPVTSILPELIKRDTVKKVI